MRRLHGQAALWKARYRVSRQPVLTLVAGCHFRDLMGARLVVSTAISSALMNWPLHVCAWELSIYVLRLLQSFLFGSKWLNLVHQLSRCSKRRPPCRPHPGSGVSHLNSGTKSKTVKWKIDRKQSTWLKNKTAEIEWARGSRDLLPPPPALRVALSVTKESVAPPSESQYCDKRRPSLEPRFGTLAANCSDSHYLTSKSPRHRYK